MGLASMNERYLMHFLNKALVFFCVFNFSLQARAALTEYQVVTLGFENPEIKMQWKAQLEKARGEMLHAGRWENPSIEYSQENLDLPGGTSEETSVWLRQKINIAGVKGLERKAAAKSYEAEEKQQAMDARHWQKTLREAFYETLAAQQKLAAIQQVYSHLKTIEKMVKQRAERGDASRFDALRIKKELSVLIGKNGSAEAKFAGLRNALFSKIDAPQQALEGRLLPTEITVESVDWSEHPQLQAIHSLQQSAEIRARAAGREHWPELTLGVGRKELNEPDISADGNLVSLGVTLPLFDHGRGEKQIAKSSVRQLKAEMILLQRQLEVAYQSALLSYRTNTDAALQLQGPSENNEQSLSRLAEASYNAGELSVMALLDAYQSDLEATEQYIDTALQARLAYLQLQFLRGK